MAEKIIAWDLLSQKAWETRERAYLVAGGKTKVGAAVLDENGQIHGGCNIQHSGRMHNEPHAEVVAISGMVVSGGQRVVAILVVAERALFTPCGGCTEWITEFGTEETLVGFQNERFGTVRTWTARELIPFHEWPVPPEEVMSARC